MLWFVCNFSVVMMSQIKPPGGNIKTAYKADAKKKPPVPKRISETYLHNSGLYYLQRYAASSARFRQVMEQKVEKSCRYHSDQDKEQCLTMIDALIEKFQRAGLLNDEVYARGLAISLRRRGLSTRGLKNKMAEKGLKAEEIEAALAQADEESGARNPDLIAAIRLAKKKKAGPYFIESAWDMAHHGAKRKEDIPDKIFAAFARSGFSYELSRRVLMMEREEADDILLNGGSD